MTPPPIYLKPNVVQNSRELFIYLRDEIVWDERMLARKTASFGVSYDYSQISYPQIDMLPELEAMCSVVEHVQGFCPNNCLINYYLDGKSSMGFHSDSSEELAPGTGVAIISLGATRSIVYRSKTNKTHEFSYPLEDGSLLYMTQEMQQHWLHAIPKEQCAGERISLTFRHILK